MTATSTPVLIPQRDLRNRSSEILRRTLAGETFVVTTRGEQVAILAPIGTEVGESRGRPPAKPATRRGGWDRLPLADSPVPSQIILDDLRGE